MDEPKNGFRTGLSTQIPTAIALLLSFILGNIQWSHTINDGLAEQTKLMQSFNTTLAEQTKVMNGMTVTLERITVSLAEITATLNSLKKG